MSRPGGRGWKRQAASLAAAEALLAAALVVLLAFVTPCLSVPSSSMEPAVPAGSLCVMLKGAAAGGYARGDIIVFPDPDGGGSLYCKRIIGLPGETVEIIGGTVYVDGEDLDEPYVQAEWTGDSGPYTVPDGCYFVLGDNRPASYDSRYWDDPYVDAGSVKGRIAVTWFSGGRFCWVAY